MKLSEAGALKDISLAIVNAITSAIFLTVQPKYAIKKSKMLYNSIFHLLFQIWLGKTEQRNYKVMSIAVVGHMWLIM